MTRPADQTNLPAVILTAWGARDPRLIAETTTSRVFRVRLADGSSAIVKDLWPIGVEDEVRGADLLDWRDGAGYVKLLARDGTTLLLEDAGEYSLLQHLDEHGDASATSVAAETLTAMHAAPAQPPPATLQPLRSWFASLFAMASTGTNAMVAEAAAVADALLDDQRDVRPLHGDLHHENLWLAERGWLAIDPKGLVGDPAYDVANMFYNPLDRDDLRTNPARIGSMARVFARTLDRDTATVLRWAFVHACLSASWHLEDGNTAKANRSLAVAAAVRAVIG